MIPHTALVMVLLLSNTLAMPRPADETGKLAGEENQLPDGIVKAQLSQELIRTFEGSSEGSGDVSEEPEEGSDESNESDDSEEHHHDHHVSEEDSEESEEDSSEVSGDVSKESEEVQLPDGKSQSKNPELVRTFEGSGDVSDKSLVMALDDLMGSGEGSGDFRILDEEIGSGIESEILVKLVDEMEEMTTESDSNLVPRFDLELGSGDGEEFLKNIEGSGDDLVIKTFGDWSPGGEDKLVIKMIEEEVEEGSGAVFRFSEISDELGSGEDSTQATVRQVDDGEMGEMTTESESQDNIFEVANI